MQAAARRQRQAGSRRGATADAAWCVQALAKKSARKGHVLHLPGWFSSQMEKALGMGGGGSDDHKVRGDSPQQQRTMWSTFAGGQELAGGVESGGQKLAAGRQAARHKALAAGKAEVRAVDLPAMQKGMRAGGFGDDTVKASSPATPLWDVFKAKSSSL